MSRYYLRLEGMNFDSFIADTQNLSTIRGGGLLLLEAAQQVARREPSLEEISIGASSGLFEFEAESDKDALRRRDRIAGWLGRHATFRHATFMVDVLRVSADSPGEGTANAFQRDKEALLALNRWRQMAAPSLAVPSPPQSGKPEPCEQDRLRPARRRFGLEPISESVRRRQEHGRRRKQNFYRKEIYGDNAKTDFDLRFSHDLKKLTEDPSQGNLNGKMAVVYLDGNRFGRLNRSLASPEDQRRLDAYLQSERRQVLRRIVEQGRGLEEMREEGGEGPLRLETLMWGGDEMAWVVPAWAGLWLIDLFFDRAWIYEQKNGAAEPLTHACGIIFCHHKAPIHRMRALAEDLAGLAKKKSRDADLLAYEVLESYDDVGDDLEAYRRRLYPRVEPEELLLEPARLRGACGAFSRLRPYLPARQVHAAARTALENPRSGEGEAAGRPAEQSEPRRRIEPWLPDEARPALGELLDYLGALGGEAAAWIHLGQLWDYLAPLPPTIAKGGNGHV